MNYKHWLICIVSVFFLISSTESIFAKTNNLQVAFIRQSNLWIKIGNVEKQITKDGQVSEPKWSFDGRWLAYKRGNELWSYQIDSEKHLKLYQGPAFNYQWSPKENKIAFQIDHVLNIIDLTKKDRSFENVALGVGNYSWTPDGKEFLASSMANLLPTGWTNVELFKIPIDAKMNPDKIQHFYTLPKQSTDFFAVQTSTFKWSENGMWIAFMAIPTASWSMDSNTLCIIRTDGTNFKKLDHMILNDLWFKWAPEKSYLAYIGGEGRMAIENKHLNIKVLPTMKTNAFTPKGFVDWDFTWHNTSLLTVSRAKEEEWSNDPKKRPLPALYQLDTKTHEQTKITSPEKGFGDYYPKYMYTNKKLAWLRSNRSRTDMWLASQDGKQAKLFIKEIDTVPDYYEKRNWDEVIDIYNK